MQEALGVALGLAFGVVFERYYLCMSSAITDVFLLRDTRKLKGLLTAVLVSAVLFNLLIGLGVAPPTRKPPWPTNLLAGVVFGIGMNLAGGCFSGTLFKMGQGHLGSFVAFLGAVLGLGTMAVLMAPLARESGGGGAVPRTTLPELLGVNPVFFALAVVVAALAVFWVRRRAAWRARANAAPLAAGPGPGGPSFIVGGALVALLNTIHLAAQARPLGLGGLMAYSAAGAAFLANAPWALANPVFDYLLHRREMAVMGLCFVAGATLSALCGGRFRFRLPSTRQAISSLVGGYLMGVSTAAMMGCNVTHILGGLPQLGVGSLLATLGIVIGARLGASIVTRIVARDA